jgi:hypothetical protein
MPGFSLILRNRTLCARQLVFKAIKAQPFLAHQHSSLISLSSDTIVAGSSVSSIQMSSIIDRTFSAALHLFDTYRAAHSHVSHVCVTWGPLSSCGQVHTPSICCTRSPSIRSPIQQVPFVSQLTLRYFQLRSTHNSITGQITALQV